MTPAPKRSWFRWSLRTMFVLVAILAWGLATRPYVVPVEHLGRIVDAGEWTDYKPEQTETLLGVTFFVDIEPDERGWNEEYGLNPQLRWPFLALATFAAWAIARQVWAWWAERRANPSTR